MILLHDIAKDEKQAEAISDFLLMKKFVLDTFTVAGKMHESDEDNKTSSKSRVLVIAKTRALLFDKIDKALQRKYLKEPPIFYSLPIVNMDWDHASELEKNIKV
ncbi:MAG: hypothetical protein ABJG78_03975 [Cyclobacteriaceae bacterium]